jgi:large subunit ribosomal protein L12
MEYVYAALLLDAAGKEVNEQDLINVVKAAGFTPDEAKAKAIASSLKGVNIKDVIKNAQASRAVAAAPDAAQPEQAKAAKKEEKEEKKSEEEAAGGLASLFG